MSSARTDPAGSAAPPPRRSFALDPDSATGKALADLAAAVDAVFALDPLALSETELLAALDGIETQTRRLPAVRDPLVAEIAVRDVPKRHGDRSVSAFLCRRWQLGAGEAHSWLSGADLFTPRRSLTSGEALPAKLAILGAARAEGHVSATQTRIITDVLHKIPAAVGPDERARAEAIMVAHARHGDPAKLAQVGQRLLAYLDPDGHLRDPDEVQRRRGLTLGRERDGLTRLSGELDAWTAAALRAALEPLANPTRTRPDATAPAGTDAKAPGSTDGDAAGADQRGDDGATAPDGCPRPSPTDTRTTPQRMHDALREAMETLLGSAALPAQAGLPATILIITKLTDLENRTGYASTAHGGLIPVVDVIRHAAKAKFIDIVVDTHGNPLFLGRTRRLATYHQRLALFTRDRGCVIPGCTVPAIRTEAHHLTPWKVGGRTNIDEMALLCGHDHDNINGWTLTLKNGRIWCTPPPWIDPTQTPTVNTYFHDPPLFDDLE